MGFGRIHSGDRSTGNDVSSFDGVESLKYLGFAPKRSGMGYRKIIRLLRHLRSLGVISAWGYIPCVIVALPMLVSSRYRWGQWILADGHWFPVASPVSAGLALDNGRKAGCMAMVHAAHHHLRVVVPSEVFPCGHNYMICPLWGSHGTLIPRVYFHEASLWRSAIYGAPGHNGEPVVLMAYAAICTVCDETFSSVPFTFIILAWFSVPINLSLLLYTKNLIKIYFRSNLFYRCRKMVVFNFNQLSSINVNSINFNQYFATAAGYD